MPDFAAAQARLGASVLRCLGNATMVLADQSEVAGFLHHDNRQAPVGIGMFARNVEFHCALEDAPDELEEGDEVTIVYRDESTAWRIAGRLPEDIALQLAGYALRRPTHVNGTP